VLKKLISTDIVHLTEDGPIRLAVKRTGRTGWSASFSGPSLEGLRRFSSLAAANRYLRRSFAQMFPEHRCDGGCAPTLEG
jgi:hypothetical protein